MQLEINAEDVHRTDTDDIKASKHHIHTVGHDRTDGLHENGGDADDQNILEKAGFGKNCGKFELDLSVEGEIENDAECARDKLTDDGCDRRTANAHTESEDHDRIKNDIRDRSRHLRDHAENGFSGGLEKAFAGNFNEHTDASYANDGKIVHSVLLDQRVTSRLRGNVEGDGEDSDEQKEKVTVKGEEEALSRDPIRSVKVFFAKRTREKRIHTDGKTDGNRDHQILYGKGDGQGGCSCHRIVHGDEYRVNDIVKCLYEHGDDDGERHRKKKSWDGNNSHFIFTADFGHCF